MCAYRSSVSWRVGNTGLHVRCSGRIFVEQVFVHIPRRAVSNNYTGVDVYSE
jgi:hypothetical protein